MNEFEMKIEKIVKNSTENYMLSEFKETTNLFEDLGYDSISIMKLIIDIEEEFGIELDMEYFDIDDLTIGKLKNMVKSKSTFNHGI